MRGKCDSESDINSWENAKKLVTGHLENNGIEQNQSGSMKGTKCLIKLLNFVYEVGTVRIDEFYAADVVYLYPQTFDNMHTEIIK